MDTQTKISKIIKESKVSTLKFVMFLLNSQTTSELLNGTWAKNDCGLNIKDDKFFSSILYYVNRNSQKNKDYLLTRKQWDILQNTTKLSKYHRQIDIFLNSKNYKVSQLRIAVNHHVKGSDDLPSFTARPSL